MSDKPTKRSMAVIHATIEDNCETHGMRGILKHADILKMVALYDDDDKQARVFGKFQHLTGLVFKKFSRKLHVIRPFRVNPADYVVWHALDPHPRNPDAVVWIAVDRKGNYFIVDELYGSYETRELAERIHRKDERYRIAERLIDPAALVEDKHQSDPEKHTLVARLSEQGLDYQRATKDRIGADRRIKDALDYRAAGDEITKPPELYIFDTCMRTIWEFEHYQWDDWRGKIAERKSPKERPMDRDDHCIECVGRILIQEPQWTPMPRQLNTEATAGKSALDFDVYE